VTNSEPTPNWDLEQLEVILEDPTSWQLVAAGPGAGKSAVACQRIASLIDDGIPPSRILLVSFTRTAVAELRDRIGSYVGAGEQAKSVRISTIDSHAWSLRAGFDDEVIARLGEGSYDLSIARTVELLRRRQPELCEFIGTLEHLVIDEAQDVMSVRADLVLGLLTCLSESCGVTILADPAQAIYGFTTDGGDGSTQTASLLERLGTECPRALTRRELKQIHRIKTTELSELFLRTRREIELADSTAGHVARVQQTIRETCGKDVGISTYPSIAEFLRGVEDMSALVLFRRRADVLIASSYCSGADVEHRIRMSDVPTVVRPWIGWLFGDTSKPIITRDEFDDTWNRRAAIASEPFTGEDKDAAWRLLHHFAAGRRGTVDLMQLRRVLGRTPPPIEFCFPELGRVGPILGTIHASKGREADTVVLVMPKHGEREENLSDTDDEAEILEEGRVYYVGATRARKMLVSAGNSGMRVGYLKSGRVYRRHGSSKAQLEVGRDGDIDRVEHFAWSDANNIQLVLAQSVGRTAQVLGQSTPEADYAIRLVIERRGDDGVRRFFNIGQFSRGFHQDISDLWNRVDTEKRLKPASLISHLYLVGVTTVALAEGDLSNVRPPFNRSGFGLAPVVKGFPMMQFLPRARRRNTQ
jgi:hypothetical protein